MLIPVILAGGSGTAATKPPPTQVDEYDTLTETIQHYIDGAKSGRGDDMKLT